MRKLQFQDGFKVARIIKKAGIKEKLQDKVKEINESKEVDQEQVGIEIIFELLESAGSTAVEEEVYDLLAGVFEMEAHQVKVMDFETLVFNIKKLVKENNITDFFKSATNLSRDTLMTSY